MKDCWGPCRSAKLTLSVFFFVLVLCSWFFSTRGIGTEWYVTGQEGAGILLPSYSLALQYASCHFILPYSIISYSIALYCIISYYILLYLIALTQKFDIPKSLTRNRNDTAPSHRFFSLFILLFFNLFSSIISIIVIHILLITTLWTLFLIIVL